MAATPAAFCPQCGTPLQGASRFCTNCGATIEVHANTPTVAAQQNPATPPASSGPGNPPASIPPPASGATYVSRSDSSLPPPPPPPVYNPYTTVPSVGTPGYAQNTLPNTYTSPPVATPSQPQAGSYQVPDYARKPKKGRGCLTGSIVLLLILVLGIGGYALVHSPLFNKDNGNTGNNTPTSGSQNNSGTTPRATTASSSGSASTVQLNLQFKYASVDLTLISVQTGHSFADDPSTSAGSAGIVRINLRENNTTSHAPNYLESESMFLLLPDGNTVKLGNSHNPISPDAGVNRENWLDFALDTQATIDQMSLRVGSQTQNQFTIPLRANEDLSKYQDKTSTPGTQFKYGPLNMTLKSATLSYSYNDQQATTGNRYVILTLGAVNNTTDTVDVYASSEMRLQAGNNTIQPDNTYTFPYSVNGNTTVEGVVAFLVPQDMTSFTLVLLAQSSISPPISQVTQPFQVQ